MQAHDVPIANLAITKLGGARIASLDQATREARDVAAIYDNVRDTLTQSYPWRFALTRALLPADSVAPAWGHARAFTLPADFLRLAEVADVGVWFSSSSYGGHGFIGGLDGSPPPGLGFELEGRRILTDLAAPLKVRYCRRVEDAGLFPAPFVNALASRLAYELAESITQSTAIKTVAEKDLRLAIMEALRSNAVDRQLVQPMDDGSWLRSRGYG